MPRFILRIAAVGATDGVILALTALRTESEVTKNGIRNYFRGGRDDGPVRDDHRSVPSRGLSRADWFIVRSVLRYPKSL